MNARTELWREGSDPSAERDPTSGQDTLQI
jgi:hypothetical protein